jgi:hypothetical protein
VLRIDVVRLARALIVAGALCGALPAPAAGEPSRCVECHLATSSTPDVARHLAEWQQSKHATHEVGCEGCHGGDPTTTESRWAHRGVLHSSVPRSPVNRANLYRTCAPCHPAEAGAFSTSLHRVLLDADELRAPSCSTCHGSMTARVPAPEVLEAQCAACHPKGSVRADYPGIARASIEQITRYRTQLAELSPEITAITNQERRRELRTKWDSALVAASRAVAAFHAFDLRRMKAALDAAGVETESVRQELER